jgi:hypothetical protein
MQTTAIGTVAKSLPQNVVILLTLLIPKRYIPYTDLRKKERRLKRGVYKLTFEDFILSNCFFVAISLLRGYFCKIICYG